MIVRHDYYMAQSGNFSIGCTEEIRSILLEVFAEFVPLPVKAEEAVLGDRITSHVDGSSIWLDDQGNVSVNVSYVTKSSGPTGLSAKSARIAYALAATHIGRYLAAIEHGHEA